MPTNLPAGVDQATPTAEVEVPLFAHPEGGEPIQIGVITLPVVLVTVATDPKPWRPPAMTAPDYVDLATAVLAKATGAFPETVPGLVQVAAEYRNLAVAISQNHGLNRQPAGDNG